MFNQRITRALSIASLIAAIGLGMLPRPAGAMVIHSFSTGQGEGTDNASARAAALSDAEAKMTCYIGSSAEKGVGLVSFSSIDDNGNTVMCTLTLNYDCVS